MRISALGGAVVAVVGLAALTAALHYDQGHLMSWTHFAPSPNLTRGATEAETARIFTMLGSFAGGFAGVIAAAGVLMALFGGRTGGWMLRIVAVLLLVLLLLISVVLIVGTFTGDEPVAIIETPLWLVCAEWGGVALAIAGFSVTTAQLWRFTSDGADDEEPASEIEEIGWPATADGGAPSGGQSAG